MSFDKAQEAFFDANAVEFYDATHSTQTEKRYNLIGLSSRRLLFVVFTEVEEGPTIWIISDRKAEKKQRKLYEEGKS